MWKLNLRYKILGGYLIVIFLMVIVGVISIVQSLSLGNQVEYLAKEVADEVKIASEIESEVISMKATVENFIYRNKEEDKDKAGQHIKRVNELVNQAKKEIKGKERIKFLKKIEDTARNIAQYDKIAIRKRAMEDNKGSLLSDAKEIEEKLYKLISAGKEDDTLYTISLESFKNFMVSRIDIERFLVDYDPIYSNKANEILGKILEDMGKVKTKKFEEAIYAIEDYKDALEGLVAGTLKMKEELTDTILPLTPKIVDLARIISGSGWMDMDKSRSTVGKQVSYMTKMIVTIIGLTFILGSIIGLLLTNLIVKPIEKMVAMLKDIAEGKGDLTKGIEVKSEDEIGQLARWFNTFIGSLHDIISKVFQMTNQVASSAEQLSASSKQIATGADHQSFQIAQVSSAVEEMSATISEVSRNSSQAVDSAKKAAETAAKGEKVVRSTKDGMKRISYAVKESASKIEELGRRSDEIGEIIVVIDEIADQTNLLALNAAIEAARAGEYGRGFAVVADEVRKLAERTTAATKQVTATIKAIQEETHVTVNSMESGAKEVDTGTELANQAGESLAQILAAVQNVTDMIGHIAISAEEQSATAKHISTNIESVSSITEENALGAKESSNACHELSIMAEELKDLVAQFKLRNDLGDNGKIEKFIDSDQYPGTSPVGKIIFQKRVA